MNALDSIESADNLLPLPEWLLTLFPDLKSIPEISQLSQVVIDELERAYQLTEKDRIVIQATDPKEMAAFGIEPIIWSPDLEQRTFASHYCKNFRLRITMRDHPLYANNRSPDKKLNESFRPHPRKCSPHLVEQTWEGFNKDIDITLHATKTNITRDLIALSLSGKPDEKRMAVENINIQLIGAVILLRLKGYAYYPDLTL